MWSRWWAFTQLTWKPFSKPRTTCWMRMGLSAFLTAITSPSWSVIASFWQLCFIDTNLLFRGDYLFMWTECFTLMLNDISLPCSLLLKMSHSDVDVFSNMHVTVLYGFVLMFSKVEKVCSACFFPNQYLSLKTFSLIFCSTFIELLNRFGLVLLYLILFDRVVPVRNLMCIVFDCSRQQQGISVCSWWGCMPMSSCCKEATQSGWKGCPKCHRNSTTSVRSTTFWLTGHGSWRKNT